jgi:ABC-type antimicrobial peptide transport system permease subunit
MFPALRQIVARLDRTVPVYDMKTLDRQLDETLSTERLIAFLSTVFGALATVMAALGLYGVMAFTVARRTNEIGLRLALGARQASVLWMVLREVLILLAAGLAAGVPCAYLLSRYVSAQLFGVTPTDLWTCLVAIAVLTLVAATAGLIPRAPSERDRSHPGASVRIASWRVFGKSRWISHVIFVTAQRVHPRGTPKTETGQRER